MSATAQANAADPETNHVFDEGRAQAMHAAISILGAQGGVDEVLAAAAKIHAFIAPLERVYRIEFAHKSLDLGRG